MGDSQPQGVMPAPEGEHAVFDGGYTSLQIALFAANLSTYTIATVFLGLRVYTSAFINRRTDWGDFFLISSWGVGAGSIACTMIAIKYGYGNHLWNVEATEITGYFQQLVAMSVTYFWTPTLTKLSVLTLIYQVYAAKWGKISALILGICIVAYTVVLTVLVTGPCDPLHGSVKCLTRAGTGHAALNIISDVLVIALPIPLVHQLQMPMRQKISVGILMTLGSLCIVASIIRTKFVADIQDNPDITWCQARVGVLSAIELNIGILGASLARLKPFVQKYLPSLSRTIVSTGQKYAGSSGFDDSKQRPGRDAYLLHSIQRSGVDTSDGQGENGRGINVKSDIYVTRSEEVTAGVNAKGNWK
ncbi:integral membrane protein [Paraphaeosphaeria sporulosa]